MKILIIIVVLIVGAFGIFLLNRDPVMEIKEMVEDDTNVVLVGNSNTKIAELIAVDGSESYGRGYRLVKLGKLNHLVTATMQDPKEGNVYEGWLVQKSPLKFFSTGILQKSENNIWTLEYKADEEFPTYNRVVITEEMVLDAIPEVHIIEGDFEE